jgi:hypothetical protein
MRQDYAELLGIPSELDSRGEAAKLGYSNTAALLMHTLRISRTEARQRLAQEEQLHDVTTPTGAVVEAAMPSTAKELAKGAIGAGHVEVIQKTLGTMQHLDREQLAWAEELMIERAVEDDPAALARYGARGVEPARHGGSERSCDEQDLDGIRRSYVEPSGYVGVRRMLESHPVRVDPGAWRDRAHHHRTAPADRRSLSRLRRSATAQRTTS